ncbi:hypothetical protein BMT00_08510 [Leuconostoc mesenteroides subsp. mesenteroides]|uniref:LacI family DNA-binding transcriptional regulator n=1 Tax=Leuconostoc mesenteroides TaxID=1245 RepID=UPI0009FF584F|nr:LacI family DNA-binding transcriptional regulator [Leuconostoc mesenteroides]ORI93982.1 hypothetical protein BMT00_08510 [Leuconostoc mesenteroides subsp. mesenteroides]
MTTIKEIALKAGYSSATVSRILNNDLTFSVTDSTRETVQTVARQLDYISVGSNQFLDINLAVIFSINPDEELEDVYYVKMRQIIEATAEKSGLKIILQSTILISLYYYL